MYTDVLAPLAAVHGQQCIQGPADSCAHVCISPLWHKVRKPRMRTAKKEMSLFLANVIYFFLNIPLDSSADTQHSRGP